MSPELQAKTGVSTPEEFEDEESFTRLGHILPCDKRESSHVIILPDGNVLYIVPSIGPSSESYQSSPYYQHFATNGGKDLLDTFSIFTSHLDDHDFVWFLKQAKWSLNIETIVEGKVPSTKELVKSKLKDVFSIARELKADIEASSRDIQAATYTGLSHLLRPST